MKKRMTKISLIALALSFALVGCKKIDLASPSEDIATGTATIKGIVYIDSDQADEADEDPALERAASANILVTYASDDLSILSSGDGTTVAITAVTGSDGSFTISVPANFEGVDYTVEVDQFQSDYTVWEVDGDGNQKSVTKSGVFARQSLAVNIKTGQTETIELNYGGSPQIDLDK